MTVKTITGTYASGYEMVPPVTDLTVAASGYVEGNGVTSPAADLGAYTLVNDGRIKAGPWGVYLYSGGRVTNGSATLETAQISGGIGVIVGEAAARVINFATIQGVGVSNGGAEGNGVVLSRGGSVTNGSATDTAALVAGATAVSVYGHAATIRNFGTLEGTAGLPYGRGVYLDSGGVITNGSATDTQALIGGPQRQLTKHPAQYFDNPIVAKGAAATVNNFGVIYGPGAAVVKAQHPGYYYADYFSTGIDLQAGGRVTNHIGGEIVASYPIVIGSGPGTVLNYGLIAPDSPGDVSGGAGVILSAGGLIVNGSAADTTARLFGNDQGVIIAGAAGTVRNFGTIEPYEDYLYQRVPQFKGAAPAAGVAAAPLGAFSGVVLEGAGVVTNYGVIAGAGGDPAVLFRSSADKLVVEAGCSFFGGVYGAGGTLELATGLGSISQIAGYGQFPSNGYVSVYGALPMETFDAFGTLEVAGGTKITLAGTGTIGRGSVSELDLVGELVVTGALATGGAVIGAGTLSMQGGQTTFEAGTSLSVAHVAEAGSATSAVVDTTLAYAGHWVQAGGALTVDAGDSLTFTGAANKFSGTQTGAGVIAFSGGADALTNATLSAATMTLSGAVLTVSNVVLEGGGSLSLTNLSTNVIKGASAAATFTNAGDRITGAGQIGAGAMLLINTGGGVIDGNQATALDIDTGANPVINAATIENSGAGGTTIAGALENYGSLIVTAGSLAVNGAVSGGGTVKIAGGTARFAAAFSQAVDFTGTAGELELGSSKTYTGEISGFSKAGTTSLDLLDIAFAGTTTAQYSGTTTSGVLTVTEGANTARITLEGNYLSSAFTLSAAPGGGTLVVDPTRTSKPVAVVSPAPNHQFVAAMAGFGATRAGTVAVAPESWRASAPMLATPRTQIA